MLRKSVVLLLVVVLVVAVFALRESIGCFFYLRASHENQIAFVREDGIYVMEPDGSSQCKLLEDNFYLGLAWSPDGQQLALINLDGNIYTVKPDGSELQQIVSAATPEDLLTFSWSTDGTQITYMRNTGGIYVIDVASGEERQITQELSAWFPVWSPDGRWIAFVTEDYALYVVHPDGSELRQLSDEARDDRPPTWSPDGERVAFINLDHEISMVDLNGSDEEVLTDFHGEHDGSVFNIAWSPTSDQIAAEILLSSPFRVNLFVLNPATRETHNLTSGVERDTHAVWTPDGAHLLYVQLPDNVLYRMNAATGVIERLATETGKAAARPRG